MSGLTWQEPTLEQARFYAQGLELGVAGEMVLGAICPELAVEQLPELSRRWSMHAKVRAARFDLLEWVRLTNLDRMTHATERTYNAMCWYLRQENIGLLRGEHLTKALRFLEAIEKKVAGGTGAPDLATKFWNEFTAKKAPGTKPTTVGLGPLQ